MTDEPMPKELREGNSEKRCRAKWAGARCHLKSGHPSLHWHDGAAGNFRWGAKKKQRS